MSFIDTHSTAPRQDNAVQHFVSGSSAEDSAFLTTHIIKHIIVAPNGVTIPIATGSTFTLTTGAVYQYNNVSGVWTKIKDATVIPIGFVIGMTFKLKLLTADNFPAGGISFKADAENYTVSSTPLAITKLSWKASTGIIANGQNALVIYDSEEGTWETTDNQALEFTLTEDIAYGTTAFNWLEENAIIQV